jgi:hypothetical protein
MKEEDSLTEQELYQSPIPNSQFPIPNSQFPILNLSVTVGEI